MTLEETLVLHGRLFGLGGATLRRGVESALGGFGLASRSHDAVRTLWGGLRRRLERERARAVSPGPLPRRRRGRPSCPMRPAAPPSPSRRWAATMGASSALGEGTRATAVYQSSGPRLTTAGRTRSTTDAILRPRLATSRLLAGNTARLHSRCDILRISNRRVREYVQRRRQRALPYSIALERNGREEGVSY
jgi:hypothetical protein